MGCRRNVIALAGVTSCMGYGVVMLNGQSGNQSPSSVSQWLRQQIVGRDLSLNPPRALSSRIEPLAKPTVAGNAVVRHRFDPKEQLPPRLYYRGSDDKILTLADDGIAPDQLAGDSTYASLVQMDLAAVRGATLAHAASQSAQPISFFKSRAKVAHSAFIDVAAVKSGGPFDWAPWGDPAVVDPERSQQWKKLDTLPIGSSAYSAALEAITQQVVVAGASPSKPNGSAINQVRANEDALDPAGGIDWEAREFQLVSATHRLKQVTVK